VPRQSARFAEIKHPESTTEFLLVMDVEDFLRGVSEGTMITSYDNTKSLQNIN
jgi:hypothetical protein